LLSESIILLLRQLKKFLALSIGNSHPSVIFVCIDCVGPTLTAWQSSGGLWHQTRWLRVCSSVTDWQSSRL